MDEDLSLRAGYYQRSNSKRDIFKNDNSLTFGIGFDFGSSNFSSVLCSVNPKSKSTIIFSRVDR